MPERVFRWVCVVLESLCFGRSVLRSGVFVKAGVCVGAGVCFVAGVCFTAKIYLVVWSV